MLARRAFLLLLFACLAMSLAENTNSWAQSPQEVKNQPTSKTASQARSLEVVKTVEVPSEPAGIFAPPLKCDSDSNLYLSTGTERLRTIRKLDATGKRLAVFEAVNQPNLQPDLVGYFSMAPGGEVYQYVFLQRDINRYIFVYRADGTLKSTIKTQPGYPWVPAQLAPFASGEVLVTGQKLRRDMDAPMLPFTGILAADGTMLKEISLEDDEDLTKKVAAGDSQISSPTNPSSNRAISTGSMASGADGNVYLMRRSSPAIFYAVNAGGAVVRRFTVDPGARGYVPSNMHVAKSRIAVLFWHQDKRAVLIKVTDLEGNEVATYEDVPREGKPGLGAALVCYSQNPDRFTFLRTMGDKKLGLMLVEPR